MEYRHYPGQLDHFPFQPSTYLSANGRSYVRKVEGIEEPFLGKVYACKELSLPKYYSNEGEKLMERVNSFKSIRNDHIVQIVATHRSGGRYNIVMEPVADGDLKQYLWLGTERSPPDQENISSWFGCLIDAVTFLHDQNIVHSRINPSHILISNNSVLLTCSTLEPGLKPNSSGHSSLVTRRSTGTTTASSRPTPRKLDFYYPLEASIGFRISEETDIFSLGVVFIEMLVLGAQYQRCHEFKDVFIDADRDAKKDWTESVVARDWMDFFGQTPEPLPWQSNVAILCAKMLSEMDERPVANDIRLWWSLQPASRLPASSCKCSLSASMSNQPSATRIKEALELAVAKNYTMSKEFLKGKAEDPVVETARWGAKELKRETSKRDLLFPGRLSKVLGRTTSSSGFRSTLT
ncbi:kinase-like protein [Lophiostoma macrostomum CBS 122681]|uniref:Kinase-like protein n=1 Tax=Lophiostoma macrostomum CBS 122681 TaxID=1314788 RepID=A0A6A6ST28_9PLEO|nr:kinase-like protein [Lophiostoma macrostomum CBS 122681]